MSKILIGTLIYIPLMVILGVGVYEIPESWYLNLVCPLSVSAITTVWLSLSLNWYDEYKEINQKQINAGANIANNTMDWGVLSQSSWIPPYSRPWRPG